MNTSRTDVEGLKDKDKDKDKVRDKEYSILEYS